MDTKWKRLIDDPYANYGIAQSDMYQMYAYAKEYETPEIYLLYPRNNEMGNRNDISFTSKDGVKVYVYFINVADIYGRLNTLKERINIKLW